MSRALNLVASNDDEDIVLTSSVTFQATAGRTYYIAVDGFDYGDGLHGDSGHIILSWTLSTSNGTSVIGLTRRVARGAMRPIGVPIGCPAPPILRPSLCPAIYAVTLNVDATVSGLVLGGTSGTQTLFMQEGHTLALSGVSNVNGHGILKLTKGTLTEQGLINLTGLMDWTAGRINGSGALTIAQVANSLSAMRAVS